MKSFLFKRSQASGPKERAVLSRKSGCCCVFLCEHRNEPFADVLMLDFPCLLVAKIRCAADTASGVVSGRCGPVDVSGLLWFTWQNDSSLDSGIF